MSEQSLKTYNVNLLGFKVPIATEKDVAAVPQWVSNSQIGRGLAYFGQDLVDIEEEIFVKPVSKKPSPEPAG